MTNMREELGEETEVQSDARSLKVTGGPTMYTPGKPRATTATDTTAPQNHGTTTSLERRQLCLPFGVESTASAQRPESTELAWPLGLSLE